VPALLTAEEYDRLPPDNRIELVDGILRIRPSATRRHQVVVETNAGAGIGAFHLVQQGELAVSSSNLDRARLFRPQMRPLCLR